MYCIDGMPYNFYMSKNQQYMILPTEYQLMNCKNVFGKCVVLIHLYYRDTISHYMNMINDIPNEIHVIFTYSDEKVKEDIIRQIKRDNYSFIYKNNRGRDISAFLVAAREELKKYEYFCFLHDKKEKGKKSKEDTEGWILFLWENIIGNRNYITNVIASFENNVNIGVLAPAFYLSDQNGQAYSNVWYSNGENVRHLLRMIGIEYHFDEQNDSFTLGTVFWARSKALEKLLDYEWKYESFDAEPLPNDGTISHAIERSLFFIARAEGYQGKYVMTDRCASEYISLQREGLKAAFDILKSNFVLSDIGQAKGFPDLLRNMCDFVKKNTHTYIYGCGKVGRSYYRLLEDHNLQVEGFIVSDKRNFNVGMYIRSVPIYEAKELELRADTGIIVGVSSRYQKEVIENIKKDIGTDNVFVADSFWN